MNIVISGPPRKPAAQAEQLQERQRLSAEATARAELARLVGPKLLGQVKGWADVERIMGVPIPAYFKEELYHAESYRKYCEYYVSSAESRMAEKLRKLAEENAAVVVEKQNLKVSGVTFKPQQRKAIDGIIAAYKAKKGGVWLPLGTGRGKTFVAGGLIQWFKQQSLIDNDNVVMPQCFYFTKKPIVLETARKLRDNFKLSIGTDAAPVVGADLNIVHYQALSTKRWTSFFRTERINVFGTSVEVDVWVPRERIVLIILDEAHELKKPKSKRTKRIMGIARAAKAAGRTVFFVAMSATNATTLDDTRWFNFCTGLTDDLNATAWLQQFVSPVKGANTGSKIKKQMDRYIEHIGPMYVRPPNDPLNYKIYNHVEIIDFPSEEAEEFYRRAEQDYIDSIKLIGGEVKNLDMAKFTLFRSAAEYIKADWYAKKAYEEVQSGRSAIIAVEFKRTLNKVLSILGSMGVTRDKISILKGDDKIITQAEVYTDIEFANLLARQDREMNDYIDTNGEPPDDPWFFLSRKEKAKVRKTRQYNQDMVRSGESRYEQIERTKWLVEMDLGKQSDEQRDREKCRFLNNDTHYLLMTCSVGGTGIDADDRIPKELGGRPRTTIGTVCYYAEQWLQALGRDARLTTLTDVHHIIAMFNRSIESQHVLPTLSKRLDAMSSMTGGAGDLEGMLAAKIARSNNTTFEEAKSVSAASEDLIVSEDDDTDDDDDDIED